MKVLFVAMAESIHTARWIGQLPVAEWDVHVFSSTPSGDAHPLLRSVTVHHLCRPAFRKDVRQRGLPVFHPALAPLGEEALDRVMPSLRPSLLARLVRRLRPDVIHSLEIQHSGYLTLRARKLLGNSFPPWLVTNWGSDIQAFREDAAHALRLRDVLRNCDAYCCECERDVRLAREMGLTGRAFPPSPNAGGYDLARAADLRRDVPSRRRLIMLKGYQGWAGRALVAIRAIEAVSDRLHGYRLCVYSASPEVAEAASRLSSRVGIPTEVFTPRDRLSHEEVLRRHGEARLSIGLSMSDGVSTSFLEAILMGSFPVQSWTSCANEWVVHGETGMLVPPEDPGEVAEAIRRVLADDALVDAAAERNWKTSLNRLDGEKLARSARAIYEQLASAP